MRIGIPEEDKALAAPLTAVVGRSGSGKSALRLRDGVVTESTRA